MMYEAILKHKPKILIVEDDIIIASDLERRLKDWDYTVCGKTKYAETALTMIEDHHPDLVIMDIELGGEMDGIEAAGIINECWGTPIVYMTAHADNIDRAVLTHPYGFILKPYRSRDLKISLDMALYVSFLDNQRKQARNALLHSEQKLSESNQILQSILDNTHMMAVLLDTKFDFIWVNQAYADTCGFERQYFQGKNHFDLYPHEENKSIFQKVVDTGKPFFVAAKPFVFPDQPERGVTYWDWSLVPVKNENGDITALVFTLADVTDRIHADETLRRKTETLNIVFESAPYMMMLVDKEGRVIDVNQSGEKFIGKAKKEVVGRLGGEVLDCVNSFGEPGCGSKDVCSNCPIRSRVESVFNSGEPVVNDAVQLGVMREGRVNTLDLLISVNPINVESFEAVLLSVIDMTERTKIINALRKSQAALKTAKESAEAANRSKSEFLANMSHEIRTPLNGILGMLQMLKNASLNDDHQAYVSTAISSGRNLLDIINDILDFSKIEAGKLDFVEEAFDLKNLLNSVIELFKYQTTQKNLKLHLEIQEGIPTNIIGDAGRLRQILFNIVGNSIKFTDHGEISLTVNRVDNKQSDESMDILFSVSDTGSGIPEDKLNYIFEPFAQADGSHKRKRGGTGLGLSIVKRLVDLMGGKIEIKSEEGKGTECSFQFSYELAHSFSEPANADGYRGEKDLPVPALNVLLAEDNQINQMVAKQFLEKIGCHVIIVEDGAMAIETLASQKVDLVMMDIQMPRMDGVEATKRIRNDKSNNFSPDIPIIAMTAHALKGDKEAFLDAGMDDYISKPVEEEELIDVILRVVKNKLM